MKTFVILVSTAVALGALLAGIYFLPIGWVLLIALAFMGAFIITDQKTLALGVVIAMFLFGAILPFKHNIYHVSHHVALKGNKVTDLDTKTTYRIASELFEQSKPDTNASKYIACQHATLFGRTLADHFCYFIDGERIYELKKEK